MAPPYSASMDVDPAASPTTARPNVLYLVHNRDDAAVRRRLTMFEMHGAKVTLAGFRRADSKKEPIGSTAIIDLGVTADGRLMQRAWRVLCHCVSPGRLKHKAAQADVIVARNLETLVIGRRILHPGQRLVYECLDIHRLLLGQGWKTRLLHRIEQWALARTALILCSAPLFISEYFNRRRGWTGPTLLSENKVPPQAVPTELIPPPPAGPPWVIGWFGMLRCQRSLAILRNLAAEAQGQIKVVIAGIPSDAEFGTDFAAQLADEPHVEFLGRYSAADLPDLYRRIHFIWAIDYFEEGLNSAWLLPNRLYEGLAHGAIPLAQRDVATGQWLTGHGVGVTFDEPATQLSAFLSDLSEQDYSALHQAVVALPADAVCQSDAETLNDFHIITGVA